jgi:hypothetical protein
LRERLNWDFLTTESAPRIARTSSPVRSRIAFATLDHCLLRFGDLAALSWRETSFCVQGIDLAPLSGCGPGRPCRCTLRSTLHGRLRSRCRRGCPFGFRPLLERPIGLPHHLVMPGRIRRGSGNRFAGNSAQKRSCLIPRPGRQIDDGLRGSVVLRHGQPRFRDERLPDFFSARRVALRKNETEWDFAS